MNNSKEKKEFQRSMRSRLNKNIISQTMWLTHNGKKKQKSVSRLLNIHNNRSKSKSEVTIDRLIMNACMVEEAYPLRKRDSTFSRAIEDLTLMGLSVSNYLSTACTVAYCLSGLLI